MRTHDDLDLAVAILTDLAGLLLCIGVMLAILFLAASLSPDPYPLTPATGGR